MERRVRIRASQRITKTRRESGSRAVIPLLPCAELKPNAIRKFDVTSEILFRLPFERTKIKLKVLQTEHTHIKPRSDRFPYDAGSQLKIYKVSKIRQPSDIRGIIRETIPLRAFKYNWRNIACLNVVHGTK